MSFIPLLTTFTQTDRIFVETLAGACVALKETTLWRIHQSQTKQRKLKMKSALIVLFLGTALAAPQFEQFKDLLKGLSGDDEPGEVNGDYEQVPYTTVQKFDVI